MIWSSEREATALAMRKQNHSYAAIGAAIGLSGQQVSNFFRRGLEAKTDKKNRVAIAMLRCSPIGPTPQQALDDRDRRLNAPRTPNMILLGDPPPSQSALAKCGAVP